MIALENKIISDEYGIEIKNRDIVIVYNTISGKYYICRFWKDLDVFVPLVIDNGKDYEEKIIRITEPSFNSLEYKFRLLFESKEDEKSYIEKYKNFY